MSGTQTYLYTYDVGSGDIVQRTFPDPSSGAWITVPRAGRGEATPSCSRVPSRRHRHGVIWELQVSDWTPSMVDDGPTDDANPVYGPGDQTLVFCRLVGADFHLFIGDVTASTT